MTEKSTSSSWRGTEEEGEPRRQPMPVIGILGGIASGKSLVAGYFAELGAGLVDADAAGHEVLREAGVREALRQRWGPDVLTADGEVNRRRVAQIVFGDGEEAPSERTFLERLTHPRITAILDRQIRHLRRAGFRAVVLDAPLLIEAGWAKLCTTLVFVEAPTPTRTARAEERGWDPAHLRAREATQASLESKREIADVVINNGGTEDATREQVVQLWRTLVEAST